MGHYYLDSSALVKRYVAEQGTVWIRHICAPGASNTLYTVRISGAEMIAALFRRQRTGSLLAADAALASTQFKSDFRSHYQVIEVTEQIVETAMTLAEKHALRGYDSVQLAAALALQTVRASMSLPPIIFLCADDKLNAVASLEGLRVENPDRYQ